MNNDICPIKEPPSRENRASALAPIFDGPSDPASRVPSDRSTSVPNELKSLPIEAFAGSGASAPVAQFRFGTKAETLERIQGQVHACAVPDQFYFTVRKWHTNANEVIDQIQRRFCAQRLAIRSSAYNEDGANRSMAGAFHSVLQVDGSSAQMIRQGIEEVIASYDSDNPSNQVLVQAMLESIALSGVIMTHDLTSGAPYYIINYDDESGRTDVITGGTGVNKTVIVHHDAPSHHVQSPRLAAVLNMIRELESVCGAREPLDIEFAQTSDGRLHLLQVRRIAVQKNWNRAVRTRLSEAIEHLEQYLAELSRPRPGFPGNTTILGQMPDWNPAELIGTEPTSLAVSLFRFLISDSVWQEARVQMGYRPVAGEPLMVCLAGRPYIDVRNSFTSFLPAGLEPQIETALIDAWLGRLAQHPEFHDKVEFEVAQTVMEFTFERNHAARYGGILSPAAKDQYAQRLCELTARNVNAAPNGPLAQALNLIKWLEQRQAAEPPPFPPLRRALHLLQECRALGTLPFSMIARHAFMAEALMRSAIGRGVWTQDRLEAFKRSLVTPAGRMSRDFAAVIAQELDREKFLQRYGHLRPGTFDILSPRYDQREDLFRNGNGHDHHAGSESKPDAFQLSATEWNGFDQLIKECNLRFSPKELLAYAGQAIVGREHAKFVFTRNLSNALESIAEWGEHIGLSREDLADLTLHDFWESLVSPITRDRESYYHELSQSRRASLREMRGLRLGYIIRDARDLYVVPLHRGAANYVTSRSLEGPVVQLGNRTTGQTDLFNRIVLIESADPGFDWIFTKGIAGLITKFGGANSHMTIRCAELGIPAAIGVGESIFDRLAKASHVELRCNEKSVRPIYG
jgi:glutamine kinase